MKIEFELDPNEVETIVRNAMNDVLREEVMRKTKEAFRDWQYKDVFSRTMTAYMKEKAPKLIDQMFEEDYEGMKSRAEQTVHNSLAKRVAASIKRMEGDNGV